MINDGLHVIKTQRLKDNQLYVVIRVGKADHLSPFFSAFYRFCFRRFIQVNLFNDLLRLDAQEVHHSFQETFFYFRLFPVLAVIPVFHLIPPRRFEIARNRPGSSWPPLPQPPQSHCSSPWTNAANPLPVETCGLPPGATPGAGQRPAGPLRPGGPAAPWSS